MALNGRQRKKYVAIKGVETKVRKDYSKRRNVETELRDQRSSVPQCVHKLHSRFFFFLISITGRRQMRKFGEDKTKGSTDIWRVSQRKHSTCKSNQWFCNSKKEKERTWPHCKDSSASSVSKVLRWTKYKRFCLWRNNWRQMVKNVRCFRNNRFRRWPWTDASPPSTLLVPHLLND